MVIIKFQLLISNYYLWILIWILINNVHINVSVNVDVIVNGNAIVNVNVSIVIVAIFAGFIGFSGEGTESMDVPSCSTGIDGLDFCDKSVMLDQEIPVPSAVNGIVVASFNIQYIIFCKLVKVFCFKW